MEAVLETFKPVRGYEGLYEVSDYGCVRSLYGGKVRYLKPHKLKDGYILTCLTLGKKIKHLLIHRLVWEAFNGPIPDGYEIDHINTIRNDNRLSNLRVVTRKENMANPITRPRYIEAMKKLIQTTEWLDKTRNAIRQTKSKPILQLNRSTGEVIREWESATTASSTLGLSRSNISDCCRNKRVSAGGYRWRFA